MEHVTMHRTYTFAHKGVQPNMDVVNLNCINRVFAWEGESHDHCIADLLDTFQMSSKPLCQKW